MLPVLLGFIFFLWSAIDSEHDCNIIWAYDFCHFITALCLGFFPVHCCSFWVNYWWLLWLWPYLSLRALLHTKARQDETCRRLYDVLGESCISCELELAGPQYDKLQSISSLSQLGADELFSFTISEMEPRSHSLSPDIKELKRASIKTDNSLSPSHTLLQISCVDHKGFLYDIMRTLKDCNIKV